MKENKQQFNKVFSEIIKCGMDVDSVVENAETMTSKNAYEKKLETIQNAEDLSTKEKLEEYEKADAAYNQKKENNVEVLCKVQTHRIKLLIGAFAGFCILMTPEGRNIAKELLTSNMNFSLKTR